jgi:hypothetical protein
MRINKSLITYQPSSGAGSGTVTSVALSAPTGFSVSGSPITSSGTLALAFTTGYGIPPLMTGNSGKFLTTNGTTMSWVNIAGTDVTGAALTENDDTNVTMTLGGTPSTALLRSVSMSLGWTGQLAVGRGGTGTSNLTGVVIGNNTSAMTSVTGTALQIFRVNSAGSGYEFFTSTFLSNPMTTSGDIIYGGVSGAPARLGANTTPTNMFLRSVSSGAPSWESITSADITGAALTRTNDTNIQVTLGGSASTALLNAASITMGWTGQLAVGRGGSGASTLTGVLVGNGTSAFTAVAGTAGQFLRRNTANTAYEFRTLQGSDIAGSELTKTDDTNVQISLGGTPASALLQPVSLTLGWTGQLAVGRGGTGASTLTGVLIGNGTSAVSGVTGTSGQLLRRNVANTAYEFFTASLLTGNGTANYVPIWTSATNILDSPLSFVSGEANFGSNKLVAGNTSAPNGSIMLQDNYSTGHLGNIGTMYSGGNLMLGYCVTPSTSSATAFLSATGLTDFTRSAIVLGTDVSIYTGAAQTVTVGSSVTMSERFRLENNGRLRLNAYTSSLSFTGIAAGYLAFTSGGYIITTATPGGVSGTQDYLAKFDSTGIAVGNSRIVDNGTNFLLNSASSYVTGLNLIGDIGIQSASGQASSILMRSNQTPTSGTSIGIFDSYAITTGTTYTQGGGIDFRASQNWNSTSAGTDIYVQTAPDNTIAPADMFVFLNNGAVRFIGRTSNPIGAAAGTMYYNSSANNMRYYNGTSWITF